MSDAHPAPSAAAPRSDRRRFLKTTSALTGGVLAAGFAPPRVHASEDETIRVGLVGCGGRGSGAAIDAMNADPGVRITAIGDLFEEPANECRMRLSRNKPEQFVVDEDHVFTGFDCYQKVIDSDIDVVLLCSPPHYRPDQMEAAVAAGKHIFCEKPIATDSTGVRRVVAACQEAKKKDLNVVSGLCWRYDQGVRETMARLLDGGVGRILTTQANYLTSPVWIRPRKPDETEMQYQARNWYYFIWASGDFFVEQFIHSIDKALWLRGDTPPVRAYGMGGRQMRSNLTQGNIYDHFSVVYEWADGSRTYAMTRQFRGCMNETEDYVFGSDGTARVLAHEIEGPESWKFTGKKVSMYLKEHQELFEAVRGQRSTINNGSYMCDSTLMSILGREVCYTGKAISWDEVAQSPQDLRPSAYNWEATPVAATVPLPGEYQFPIAKGEAV